MSLEDWIEKRPTKLQAEWQKRWFTLHQDRLSYRDQEQVSNASTKPKWTCNLRKVSAIQLDRTKKFVVVCSECSNLNWENSKVHFCIFRKIQNP